MFTIGV